jgi:hypothetical protein
VSANRRNGISGGHGVQIAARDLPIGWQIDFLLGTGPLANRRLWLHGAEGDSGAPVRVSVSNSSSGGDLELDEVSAVVHGGPGPI